MKAAVHLDSDVLQSAFLEQAPQPDDLVDRPGEEALSGETRAHGQDQHLIQLRDDLLGASTDEPTP